MITDPNLIEQVGMALFGRLDLFALAVMFIILCLFLLAGIDARLSIILIAPLIVAFSQSGWFAGWVGGLAWAFIIGISIYIAISWIINLNR